MQQKHVSILVAAGSHLGSIENSRNGFLEVNRFLENAGKAPLFTVQLAGLSKTVRLGNGMYTVRPDVLVQEIRSTDLIIVPAFSDDIRRSLKQNQAFIPWIVRQYKAGAEMASMCVGSFLLASTGLLNGKSCSTHWQAAEAFRAMFPEVDLVTDKIITDEHGIYSSGGAFSSANLILYIIEKYAGREAAVYCSKVFQIDIERSSQSPFIIFQGQKDHEDEPVKRAQEFIEKNYRDKISVEQLTDMLALGRRNFERRFKKATSNTVVEYIQRVKMEAAKKNLEAGGKTINELMYDVGYSDTKAFRSIFKKITGLSPVEYRNKYSKELWAV
ncbi:GlxA family transcriptional regulator [Compostibacter hankyongensis]|uniref:Helix-turn-helix domain-containing protein n=1 Tax=Compostibacter hankyongensis TaxID=1007089 RepID=A0ABP8FFW2_9BACT